MVSYTSNFLHFNFISISAFFYFTLHFRKQGKLSSSYINNCLNFELVYIISVVQVFILYTGYIGFQILEIISNIFFSVIRLDYSCLGIQQYSLFHNMSGNMILKRNPVKGKKLWILVISSTFDFRKSVKISKHEVTLILLKIYI